MPEVTGQNGNGNGDAKFYREQLIRDMLDSKNSLDERVRAMGKYVDERFERLEAKLDSVVDTNADISKKMGYIMGYASGVALVVSVSWGFLKDKIFNLE